MLTVDEKVSALKKYFDENSRGHEMDYMQKFDTSNHSFRFTINMTIRLFEISDNYVDDHDLPEIIAQIERLRIIERIVAGPDSLFLSNEGLATK
jgi:hypothetical protein